MDSIHETPMVQVSCTTTDPKMSADICNSVLQVAPAAIKDVVTAGEAKAQDYAVVPLFDECHEKYGERMANLDYAYAYYGEIRVEGNHYDVGDDFNIAELPTVSQNALYKAIFKALEQQKDQKEEKS